MVKDRLLLQLMENILNCLYTLDLKNVFLHIAIDKGTTKYTTLVTRDGH